MIDLESLTAVFDYETGELLDYDWLYDVEGRILSLGNYEYKPDLTY